MFFSYITCRVEDKDIVEDDTNEEKSTKSSKGSF